MPKNEKVEMLTQPKIEPTVYFSFDKDFKAPSSFKNLTLDDEVRAVVIGKVKNMGLDPENVSIIIKKVDFEKTGPKTIAEAKTIARERVKDFK